MYVYLPRCERIGRLISEKVVDGVVRRRILIEEPFEEPSSYIAPDNEEVVSLTESAIESVKISRVKDVIDFFDEIKEKLNNGSTGNTECGQDKRIILQHEQKT